MLAIMVPRQINLPVFMTGPDLGKVDNAHPDLGAAMRPTAGCPAHNVCIKLTGQCAPR